MQRIRQMASLLMVQKREQRHKGFLTIPLYLILLCFEWLLGIVSPKTKNAAFKSGLMKHAVVDLIFILSARITERSFKCFWLVASKEF